METDIYYLLTKSISKGTYTLARVSDDKTKEYTYDELVQFYNKIKPKETNKIDAQTIRNCVFTNIDGNNYLLFTQCYDKHNEDTMSVINYYTFTQLYTNPSKIYLYKGTIEYTYSARSRNRYKEEGFTPSTGNKFCTRSSLYMWMGTSSLACNTHYNKEFCKILIDKGVKYDNKYLYLNHMPYVIIGYNDYNKTFTIFNGFVTQARTLIQVIDDIDLFQNKYAYELLCWLENTNVKDNLTDNGTPIKDKKIPQLTTNIWKEGNYYFYLDISGKEKEKIRVFNSEFIAELRETNNLIKSNALKTKLLDLGIPLKAVNIENNCITYIGLSTSELDITTENKHADKFYITLPSNANSIGENAISSNVGLQDTYNLKIKVLNNIKKVHPNFINNTYTRLSANGIKCLVFDISNADIDAAGQMIASIFVNNIGYVIRFTNNSPDFDKVVTDILSMRETYLSYFTNKASNPYINPEIIGGAYITHLDLDNEYILNKETPFKIKYLTLKELNKVKSTSYSGSTFAFPIRSIGVPTPNININLSEREIQILNKTFYYIMQYHKNNIKKKRQAPKFPDLLQDYDNAIWLKYNNKYRIYIKSELYRVNTIVARETMGRFFEDIPLIIGCPIRYDFDSEKYSYHDVEINEFLIAPIYQYFNSNKELYNFWKRQYNEQVNLFNNYISQKEIQIFSEQLIAKKKSI